MLTCGKEKGLFSTVVIITLVSTIMLCITGCSPESVNIKPSWNFSVANTNITCFEDKQQVQFDISVNTKSQDTNEAQKFVCKLDSYVSSGEQFSLIFKDDDNLVSLEGVFKKENFFLKFKPLIEGNDSIVITLQFPEHINVKYDSCGGSINLSGIGPSSYKIHTTAKRTNRQQSHIFHLPLNDSLHVFSGDNDFIAWEDLYSQEDITINEINLSGRDSSLPSIKWLYKEEMESYENVLFVQDTSIIRYVNPNFFRFYLQMKLNAGLKKKENLPLILKNILKNNGHPVPLTASLALMEYRSSGDKTSLNDILLPLIEMNRKWDILLEPYRNNEAEKKTDLQPVSSMVYGLPPIFYISVFVHDCNNLTQIASLLGKQSIANEFRNRAMLYTIILNKQLRGKMEDTKTMTAFDLMPAISGSLSQREMLKLTQNFNRFNQLQKVDEKSIYAQYEYISLLLVYGSLTDHVSEFDILYSSLNLNNN